MKYYLIVLVGFILSCNQSKEEKKEESKEEKKEDKKEEKKEGKRTATLLSSKPDIKNGKRKKNTKVNWSKILNLKNILVNFLIQKSLLHC